MRRFLLLFLLFILTGTLTADAQSAYITYPRKVCLDAYASVRAFRSDKGTVDHVRWQITLPDGSIVNQTSNNTPSAANAPLFRYIGSKGQSMTINLMQTGVYSLRARVYRNSSSYYEETAEIEVEDCTMEVCQGDFSPSSDFKETFGQFPIGDNARRRVDPAVATIEYEFDEEGPDLADNWYSIHWNSQDGGKTQWDYVEDHTRNGRGGMLIANSSYEKKTFYKRLVTDLCPGAKYNFSAWFINLNSREVLDNVCQNTDANPYRYAGVTFIIRNAVTNAIIKQFNTNDVSMDLSRPDLSAEEQRLAGWQQFGGTVELAGGQESVWVEIANNNPGGCGNDIAIDDIEFKYCGPRIHSYIDGEFVTDNLVCPGAALTLTSVITPADYFTNPVYSWEINKQDGNDWQLISPSDPGYTGATTPTLSILTGTLPEKNTYLYRLMVIEAGNEGSGRSCYTPSNFVTLRILEMPSLTAAGRICQGDMTKLTANYLKTPSQDGYETFVFTGPDIVTPWPEGTPQPANEIYVRPSVTSTYTVTGSVQYGNEPTTHTPRICYRTTSAEIIVDERPVVELGPDMRVCVNTPVTLDAGADNAAYSIRWTPGNQTTQTIDITSPATGNATQNYAVTVTNGVCVITDDIDITSARTIPAVITTTSPIQCSDVTKNFTLTASLQTGYSATWEIVGDPHGATITPNGTNPNMPTLTNMPLNTDVTIRLTVTADGTTCSTTAERVFRLNTNPVATVAANNITQCSPDFVMDANTPDASLGHTGRWTVTPANANVYIDPAEVNNPAAPISLLNGITTATVRWTVSGPTGTGTCPPKYVNVTLNVLPPVTIAVSDASRCIDPSNLTFSIPFTTSGTPARYDLIAEDPLPGFTDVMNVTLSGSSFSIPYSASAPAGTYTFRAVVRKNAGTTGICDAETTFELTIAEPSTPPTIAVPSIDICAGNSATLTVSGTLGTGAEWVWYTGGCNGTEVDRGASISVTPTVTTTYYVKAVSSGPCGNTVCATVTVNVYEDPSTADAGNNQEHCDDDQFSLAAANPTVGTGLWSGTLPAGASISSWSDRNASVTLPAGQ
ncbi:immunoglobulin domain-containing protein, partial [Chitinophaga alhagiae]|uniref:immunoglobulin domain-containing protein n=1 Tax=Chitinophaga alhagiae TaxID=2203219 RepID=UPI00130040CC